MRLLAPVFQGPEPAVDPLRSDFTLEAHVEITTRCNLRCTYCAASQPSYRAQDMDPEVLREAIYLLKGRTTGTVYLNAHGETTARDDWLELCRPLLEGFTVGLISNLARRFSLDECAMLARFRTIAVSLDTADPDLLAKIRRRVRLETILGNMRAIRRAAADLQIPGPRFIFLSGIYDRNVYLLEGLARLAIDEAVDLVQFWNLTKYPDLPRAENVRPLTALTPAEQRRALATIDSAVAMLEGAGIPVSFCGGFVDQMRDRLATEAAAS